jgi:hypothetical protein
MLNLYENITNEKKAHLANELGFNPADLEFLNFDIRKVEDLHGDVVYRFILLGDNPNEIVEKIIELVDKEVEIPDYIFEDDDEEWYDYDYVSSKEPNQNLEIFLNELENLSRLNKMPVSDYQMLNILKKQIYIGIIGSMETYLSDTFIGLVLGDRTYLERFIATTPEFTKRKFELREIFSTYREIEKTAQDVMLDVIYHDLAKVRLMYIQTFEMDFPSIKEVFKCIKVRHDLVHRNGKTKDRQIIKLNERIIDDTLKTIQNFIVDIAGRIADLGDLNDIPF